MPFQHHLGAPSPARALAGFLSELRARDSGSCLSGGNRPPHQVLSKACPLQGWRTGRTPPCSRRKERGATERGLRLSVLGERKELAGWAPWNKRKRGSIKAATISLTLLRSETPQGARHVRPGAQVAFLNTTVREGEGKKAQALSQESCSGCGLLAPSRLSPARPA